MRRIQRWSRYPRDLSRSQRSRAAGTRLEQMPCQTKTRHTPHVTRHTRHTPHALRRTSHATRHTSHATRQSHSTCSVMISARVKGWPQDEEVEFVTQIACGTLHALAVSLHCHIFALCLLLLFLLCIIIVSIIIVMTDHSHHYRHILHPFKRLHFACCDAAN
jgi:hypothetical protein